MKTKRTALLLDSRKIPGNKTYEVELIGRNALATKYKEVDRVTTRIEARFNHMNKAKLEKRKFQLDKPMIIYDLFKVVEL